MASPLYECTICQTETRDHPPPHCPKCGAPGGRYRLVVDRPPKPPPAPDKKPEPEEEAAEA